MNITCIPYHDWRKIDMEGARTRDAHIIHHLHINENIDNIVVVNRPIAMLELLVKKKLRKIKGEKVFKSGNCTLYKIDSKLYLVDYISTDIIAPVTKGKAWFFESFGYDELYNGYLACLKYLDIEIDLIFTQNVFSASFFKDRKTPAIFDAWDNFLLFPENKNYENLFIKAYQSLASFTNGWITNSVKNIDFYNKNYSPKFCHLVKNGVDTANFSKPYELPDDLKVIPSPRIGFGGKITHLFDYDLYNKIVKMYPDKSFVLVGQILDQGVFKKINKAPNVFYLGDKHYSLYPAYVKNFDIGIIPYVTGELEHGADSIKVYEYIACGLNVVGTAGAGMSDLKEYIYVAKNSEEFGKQLEKGLNNKKNIALPDFYTWKYKASSIVDLFREIKNNKS